MELKDRLRQLRESENMTQKECAKALDVEYANYNKWENGKAPNLETLTKIANHYKTTTDYLLGLSDERYAAEKVSIPKWESALLSQTTNMLNNFFIKYSEYQKSPDAFDLASIFFVAIKGGISSIIENQKSLLDELANIKEKEKMSDIDKIVESYLNNAGEIHVGGRKNSDGSWSNSISDFELELWLRDLIEENVPGYLEYRDKKINEFIAELTDPDRVTPPKEVTLYATQKNKTNRS